MQHKFAVLMKSNTQHSKLFLNSLLCYTKIRNRKFNNLLLEKIRWGLCHAFYGFDEMIQFYDENDDYRMNDSALI